MAMFNSKVDLMKEKRMQSSERMKLASQYCRVIKVRTGSLYVHSIAFADLDYNK